MRTRPRRARYQLRLRNEAGEEHDRMIFATDPEAAKERAIVRARMALGKTMAERHYGQYTVISCEKMDS